jgi:hypothetical protein
MFTKSRSADTVPLPLEDGTVSATSLTLDRETAGRKFETATFGLG